MNGPPDPVPDFQVGAHTSLPAAEDRDALKYMESLYSTELERTRTRAEKWTAGLAAIAGVLATAAVVSGPDNFTKLGPIDIGPWTPDGSDVVMALMGIGAVLLGTSIYLANRAANGSPLKETQLASLGEGKPAWSGSGAARDLRKAYKDAVDGSRRDLKHATIVTVAATVALASAIGVTWLSPAPSESSASTCIRVEGGSITEIDGGVPPVLGGTLTVVPCP